MVPTRSASPDRELLNHPQPACHSTRCGWGPSALPTSPPWSNCVSESPRGLGVRRPSGALNTPQSGRGLSQSKTLARIESAPTKLASCQFHARSVVVAINEAQRPNPGSCSSKLSQAEYLLGGSKPLAMQIHRKAKMVRLVVAAAVVAAVVVFYQRQLESATDAKKIRMRAYLMAGELQRYVRRTGQFPASLQAMVTEGSLEQHYLSPPKGCTVTYTQPSLSSAGTAAVLVVACGRHEVVVTKDFQKVERP